MRRLYELANHTRAANAKSSIPSRPTPAAKVAAVKEAAVKESTQRRRYKNETQRKDTPVNNPDVPLAVFVIEGHAKTVDELARRLDGEVFVKSGVLWCSGSTGDRLRAERAAAQAAAAEAEHARRAQHEARMAEIRRSLPPLRGGVPAVSGSAFTDMVEMDQR